MYRIGFVFYSNKYRDESFHSDTINKIGAGLEKCLLLSASTLNVLKMYMCKVRFTSRSTKRFQLKGQPSHSINLRLL